MATNSSISYKEKKGKNKKKLDDYGVPKRNETEFADQLPLCDRNVTKEFKDCQKAVKDEFKQEAKAIKQQIKELRAQRRAEGRVGKKQQPRDEEESAEDLLTAEEIEQLQNDFWCNKVATRVKILGSCIPGNPPCVPAAKGFGGKKKKKAKGFDKEEALAFCTGGGEEIEDEVENSDDIDEDGQEVDDSTVPANVTLFNAEEDRIVNDWILKNVRGKKNLEEVLANLNCPADLIERTCSALIDDGIFVALESNLVAAIEAEEATTVGGAVGGAFAVLFLAGANQRIKRELLEGQSGVSMGETLSHSVEKLKRTVSNISGSRPDSQEINVSAAPAAVPAVARRPSNKPKPNDSRVSTRSGERRTNSKPTKRVSVTTAEDTATNSGLKHLSTENPAFNPDPIETNVNDEEYEYYYSEESEDDEEAQKPSSAVTKVIAVVEDSSIPVETAKDSIPAEQPEVSEADEENPKQPTE